MGVVVSQSIKNTVTTYLGFGIGAINVLFLFTNFISDTYFGLITFMLSTANIMMPLMAFGTNNTLIKFYSIFKTRQSQNSFLTLMLFLPLVIIIPLGLIGHLSFEVISNWISQTNPIIKDYYWLIYVSAISFAYFEVFYAWSRVQMQSVFGNFMKEVFHRLATTVLLFCLYFNLLNVEQLIYSIVGVYLLRMVLMAVYAFSLRHPVFKFHKFKSLSKVLKYTALIIVAGSVANLILEIDKFMLGYYVDIEKVAYYGVAIYIASVIGVPLRSLHQIISPVTAKLLNEKDHIELKKLYHKSSLNLFIISGFIFLLIILNINELYLLIPEKFSGGLVIVILIGVAKLMDSILGNNNAILFNSDYYKMVLLLGVFLVITTIVFNMIFIPLFGINGAAFATFIAVLLYNLSKILFVQYAFKMTPFTLDTLKATGLIVVSVLVFYFWEFPFHSIINIGLKTLLFSSFYGFVVYKFSFSEDITTILNRFLKPLK
ncbi:oligosaccharide flippase family protein [Gaetbulibacter sp. M235]|uniref:lipopolysaccharide biosynthesis protein n=1 Tax=Gaetbulibacter sp. M235 TaxID=3126510 RepID=UPI00374F143F